MRMRDGGAIANAALQRCGRAVELGLMKISFVISLLSEQQLVAAWQHELRFGSSPPKPRTGERRPAVTA
jgi:hypothetical protein